MQDLQEIPANSVVTFQIIPVGGSSGNGAGTNFGIEGKSSVNAGGVSVDVSGAYITGRFEE